MNADVRLVDEVGEAPVDEPDELPDDEPRVGIETPEADAVEQYLPADPDERPAALAGEDALPDEADPADVLEQRQPVPREEDGE